MFKTQKREMQCLVFKEKPPARESLCLFRATLLAALNDVELTQCPLFSACVSQTVKCVFMCEMPSELGYINISEETLAQMVEKEEIVLTLSGWTEREETPGRECVWVTMRPKA